MTHLRTLLIFGLFIFVDCSHKTHKTGEKLPTVDLCDLPKYTNQKVYLKCEYSGVEEYWNLTSITNRSCDQQLSVDLDFVKDYDQIPKRFRRKLRQVRQDYPISKLSLEVIGLYETEKGHYGHLGSNKSRFLVSEIRKMDVMKK